GGNVPEGGILAQQGLGGPGVPGGPAQEPEVLVDGIDRGEEHSPPAENEREGSGGGDPAREGPGGGVRRPGLPADPARRGHARGVANSTTARQRRDTPSSGNTRQGSASQGGSTPGSWR